MTITSWNSGASGLDHWTGRHTTENSEPIVIDSLMMIPWRNARPGLISDTSLEANDRSIIQGDITNTAGSGEAAGQARLLDETVDSGELWGSANPRAHERAATMIAVASLMPRGSGRRGTSEPEIKVASCPPSITYGSAPPTG